ncbi:MAG: patatin-like phospholipase family protein, partial [Legionella longbeachae]|nr:patatin-like phospholipase family protein [Legionella longbeachae]
GGAIEALEQKGILENVDTVAGSSAGSLTALLVALGMTAAEIKEQIDKTDFNEFKDPSLFELFSKRGLCKGDVLTDHIQKTIETFLPKKINEAKGSLLVEIIKELQSIVDDPNFQSAEIKIKLADYIKIFAKKKELEDKVKELRSLSGEKTVAQSLEKLNEILAEQKKNETEIKETFNELSRVLTENNVGQDKAKIIRNTLIRRYQAVAEINLAEVTFSDLKLLHDCIGNKVKRLIITGTNITDKKLDIFSDETTPNMPIRTAARISASFPLVFQAVEYDGKKYIDGGAFDNLPVRHLLNQKTDESSLSSHEEKIEEVLGFDLNAKVKMVTGLWVTLLSWIKYLVCAKVDLAANNAELMHALKYDFSEQMINLSVDINTLDFKLTQEKKTELQENAKNVTANAPALNTGVKTTHTGDLLQCLLAIPKNQLNDFEDSIWEVKDQVVDLDENSLRAKNAVINMRENEENKLIDILGNLRFINRHFEDKDILKINPGELEQGIKSLIKALDAFVLPKIDLDDGKYLDLEMRHKAILYKRVNAACSMEIQAFSKNINSIMQAQQPDTPIKDSINVSAHAGFIQNLRFEQVKREAMTELVKAKAKPFQLEANITLIDESI